MAFLVIDLLPFLLVISPAVGYPTYVPRSACRNLVPSGHLVKEPRVAEQETKIPYLVDIGNTDVYTQDDTIQFTLRGSVDFRGFICQAVIGDSNTIVGRFINPPPDTQLMTCSNTDDSITHNKKTLKRGLSLFWKAPSVYVGPVTFRCTIVYTFSQFWPALKSASIMPSRIFVSPSPKARGLLCFRALQGNCQLNQIQQCTQCRTESACADRCLSRPDCRGFSYLVAAGYCILKNRSCDIPTNDAGVVFYERLPSCDAQPATPRVTPVVVQSVDQCFARLSGNCEGHFLRDCTNCTGLSSCYNACYDDLRCLGFTYILNRGTCLLKLVQCRNPSPNRETVFYNKRLGCAKSVGQLTTPSSEISCYQITPNGECTISLQRPCPGCESLQLCASTCLFDSICFGFNFYPDTKECFFTDNSCATLQPVTSATFYRKNFACGLLFPTAPGRWTTTIYPPLVFPCFKLFESSDCVGDVLRECREATCVGLTGCAETCQSDPRCLAFTFVWTQNICFLKTNVCSSPQFSSSSYFYEKRPECYPGTTRTISTTSPAPVFSCFQLHANKDCALSQLLEECTQPGCRQAGGCAARCESLNFCSAFSFWKSQQRCLLKLSTCQSFQLSDNLDVNFYQKRPQCFVTTSSPRTTTFLIPQFDCFEVLPRVDCSGSTLYECTQGCPTTTDCARTCEGDSRCLSFIFYQLERRCVLKSTDCLVRVSNPSANFYLKKTFCRVTTTTSSPATRAPDFPCFLLYQNQDCRETDLSECRLSRCSDPTGCSQSCEADPRCLSFVFYTRDRRCFFKATQCVSGRIASLGVNVYTKRDSCRQTTTTPTAAPQEFRCFILTTSQDCRGGDLRECSQPQCSATAGCSQVCEADPSCLSFVFYPRERRCFLKSTLCSDRLPSSGVYLYIKRDFCRPQTTTQLPQFRCFSSFPNQDCRGQDLFECSQCSDLTSCSEQCQAEPRCLSFVFYSQNRRCFLKSNTCPGLLTATPNVQFYLKRDICRITTPIVTTTRPPVSSNNPVDFRCFTLHADQDCRANDLFECSQSRCVDVVTCSQSCELEPRCLAVVYYTSENRCFLKSAGCLTSLSPRPGVNTYNKQNFCRQTTARPPQTSPRIPEFNCFQLYPGQNCRGSLLRECTLTKCVEPLGCAQVCESELECLAFTFLFESRRCLLKLETCQNPEPNPAANYYVKRETCRPSLRTTPSPSVPPEFSCFELLVDRNCPLDDLRECPESSCITPAGCANACEISISCRAFTFFSAQKRCFLKNRMCESPETRPSVYLYRKLPVCIVTRAPTTTAPVSFTCFELFQSANCPGDVLRECTDSRCADVTGCFESCEADQACLGFSFLIRERRCLLKARTCDSPAPTSEINFYKRRPECLSSPVTKSTIRQPTDPPVTAPQLECYRGYYQSNCRGNILNECTTEQCRTRLGCGRTCQLAGSECAGFSFLRNERRCFLKTGACDRPEPNSNVDFYVKQPGCELPPSPSSPFPRTGTSATPSTGLNCFDPFPQRNCAGSLLRECTNANCRDLIGCASECLFEANCRGFSYLRSERRCLLKDTACDSPADKADVDFYKRKTNCGGQTRRSTQPTLPTASPTALSCFTSFPGRNCRGNIIGECVLASCGQAEGCAAQCLLDNDCQAFIFLPSEGKCFAKSFTCSNPQPNPEVNYFVKVPGCVVPLPSTTPGPTSPCGVLECPDIPSVLNALHNGRNSKIGTTVTYTCNSGYRLQGSATIRCLESGRWQPQPICSLGPRARL